MLSYHVKPEPLDTWNSEPCASILNQTQDLGYGLGTQIWNPKLGFKTWICHWDWNPRPRAKMWIGIRTVNSYKTNALYFDHNIYIKSMSRKATAQDCWISINITCFQIWWKILHQSACTFKAGLWTLGKI